MKTIQISNELWKALRIEAAHRGVTMREVVTDWLTRGGVMMAKSDGAQEGMGGIILASEARERRAESRPVKELAVVKDEWIP